MLFERKVNKTEEVKYDSLLYRKCVLWDSITSPKLTFVSPAAHCSCCCRNGLLLVPCSSSLPEQSLLLPKAHRAELGQAAMGIWQLQNALSVRRGCTNLCCALQLLLGAPCWENAFTHTESTSSKVWDCTDWTGKSACHQLKCIQEHHCICN